MRELYLYTSLQTIQLKQLIIRMTLFIPRCSASVWGIITINSQKYIIIYKVTHIYFYFVRSLNLWHTSIVILVKYLNLKSVPMFWIYFLCSIKCIDFFKTKTCISNTRVCVSYEKSGPITTFGPDYFILLIIFYELKKITIIFMNFIYEKDRIFFL